MSWQPSLTHIQLFAADKQRSAAYTLERRSLRQAMLSFSEGLGGPWDCTPAEPCLANRRRVENLVLFSQAIRPDGQRASIDLSSPFALDVLPFHEHLSRFVQVDGSGLTWGLILHQKATLDGRNMDAFLAAFEGDKALLGLLEPLADAQASCDAEAPLAEGASAATLLPKVRGKGWCVWWRAQRIEGQLSDRIAADIARLDPLFRALKWRSDNDLCGAKPEHKDQRQEAAKSRFRVGDQVRITAGLFAGRVGRIEQRLDKGGVSLGIGPITICVADDQIAPL